MGVVGPNGAGKSTLLLTIAGVLRPTQGGVQLGDESLVRQGTGGHRARGAFPWCPSGGTSSRSSRSKRISRWRPLPEPKSSKRRAIWRSSTNGFQYSVSARTSRGRESLRRSAAAACDRPRPAHPPATAAGGRALPRPRADPCRARIRFPSRRCVTKASPSSSSSRTRLATIEMSDRIYVLRRGEIALEGEGTDATIRADIVKVLHRSTRSRRADHVGSLGAPGRRTMIAQHFVDAISLGSLYALAVLGHRPDPRCDEADQLRPRRLDHGRRLFDGGPSAPTRGRLLILGTLATTTLLALLMERTAFRPVRGASAATLLITSLHRELSPAEHHVGDAHL